MTADWKLVSTDIPKGVEGAWPYPAEVNATGPIFFGPVTPAKFNTKMTSALSTPLTPFITFKPSLSDVSSGKWDATLDSFRKSRVGKAPVYIYPWHEPENDFPASDFVKMFNRVYSHLSSAEVKVGYTAMAYQWRPGSSSTKSPEAWRPAKYDWLGCDVYSGKTWPTNIILPEHPGFVRWRSSFAKTEPYILTERGFQGTNSARTAAIRREADWIVTDGGCRGYLYWNSPGTENDSRWVLDGSGVDAVRYLFSTI